MDPFINIQKLTSPAYLGSCRGGQGAIFHLIVLGFKLFYMMGIWLGNMFGIRLKSLQINLHGKRQGTFVYLTYI